MRECAYCGKRAVIELNDRPHAESRGQEPVPLAYFCSWTCAGFYCLGMAKYVKMAVDAETTKPPRKVIDAYDALDLSWHDAHNPTPEPETRTIPEGAWMRLT